MYAKRERSIFLGHPIFSGISSTLIWSVAGIFIFTEFVNISVRMAASLRANKRHLLPWVPSLYCYFPLATFAAVKGLSELLTKPFYWDKTAHGVAKGQKISPPENENAI